MDDSIGSDNLIPEDPDPTTVERCLNGRGSICFQTVGDKGIRLFLFNRSEFSSLFRIWGGSSELARWHGLIAGAHPVQINSGRLPHRLQRETVDGSVG